MGPDLPALPYRTDINTRTAQGSTGHGPMTSAPGQQYENWRGFAPLPAVANSRSGMRVLRQTERPPIWRCRPHVAGRRVCATNGAPAAWRSRNRSFLVSELLEIGTNGKVAIVEPLGRTSFVVPVVHYGGRKKFVSTFGFQNR